jgi:hypothetical protein
MDDTDKTS